MNVSRTGLGFSIAALLIAGCGAAAVPTARIVSAEAAIRAAQESGAANTPNAALHLHYAELAKVEAQRLASNGDNDRAVMQFRRAEADANLALALRREAEAQHGAQTATETLRATPTPETPR